MVKYPIKTDLCALRDCGLCGQSVVTAACMALETETTVR